MVQQVGFVSSVWRKYVCMMMTVEGVDDMQPTHTRTHTHTRPFNVCRGRGRGYWCVCWWYVSLKREVGENENGFGLDKVNGFKIANF